jgi:plastocyanin
MSKTVRVVSFLSIFALAGVGCGGKEETGGAGKGTGTAAGTASGTGAGTAAGTGSVTPPPAGASGTIKGKIVLEGAAPAMPELPRHTPDGKAKDDKCQSKEKAGYLTVAADGSLADVFVRIPAGAAKGDLAKAATPLEVDQRNCIYHPHVAGVLEGQKISFINSDGTLHNIHGWLGTDTVFNNAHRATEGPKAVDVEVSAGQVLDLKCDAHPWMESHIVKMDHPFFAVTGADGTFTINQVPAGKYSLEVWHPHMKDAKTVAVTVEAGKTADVTAAFKADEYVPVAQPQ